MQDGASPVTVQQVAEAAQAVAQTSQSMNTPTLIGSIIGGLVLVLVAAKPLISKLRVSGASDSAQIDAFQRLAQLLDDERVARRAAEERADKFAQERNDAMMRIGTLEGEVKALRQEIESLRKDMERRNGGS